MRIEAAVPLVDLISGSFAALLVQPGALSERESQGLVAGDGSASV